MYVLEAVSALYLGEIYSIGKGIGKDLEQAKKYYQIAYNTKYEPHSIQEADYVSLIASAAEGLGFIYFEKYKNYTIARKYLYEAYDKGKRHAAATLYNMKLTLIKNFNTMLENIKNKPTFSAIEQAKGILREAQQIKFIKDRYNKQLNGFIKDGYQKLSNFEKRLQEPQEPIVHTSAEDQEKHRLLIKTLLQKIEQAATSKDYLETTETLLSKLKISQKMLKLMPDIRVFIKCL